MQRKYNNKKGNGFTLIELLIVIAVIAVLVAILIPNIRGFRTEASKARAQGDLDTLKKAVLLYISKYDQLPGKLADLIDPQFFDAKNRLISKVPYDPFNPNDSGPAPYPQYTYIRYNNALTQFTSFAVYSWGPNKASTLNWKDEGTLQSSSDDIIATEAKIE